MALKFAITIPVRGYLPLLLMIFHSSKPPELAFPVIWLYLGQKYSSFIVSFYVPKENQPDPPSAKGLHVQKWGRKYVAESFGRMLSTRAIESRMQRNTLLRNTILHSSFGTE
ncbi:unnamed protein product [Fraxinus pennsylvanica]|uniref:Uncharacterized protein n=1 Tax=Fraxinus pennsylvanica TaxID=56036 RepID=A0AAD2EBC1_9LAMI|nr:unnamed protein product [Fraxinus pennsylvanica]